MFNIFLNDLFSFIQETEICNFADDNTLYACDSTIEKVISRLENDILHVNTWFKNNSMIANQEKFQVMFLGVKDPCEVSLKIGNLEINGQSQVLLLGITIDHKLNFSSHIKTLCKNANNKISTLLRLRSSLSYNQTQILINSYIMSYFYYCPIIWMFCQKIDYKLIQRTHKRAIRVLVNNFEADYPLLLKQTKSVSVHTRHLQFLMIEVFKTKQLHNPKFMKEVFTTKTCHYQLRNNDLLTLKPTRTATFGTRSISFKGSLIWNKLPTYLKDAETITKFKELIKTWPGTECSCKICT